MILISMGQFEDQINVNLIRFEIVPDADAARSSRKA